MPWRQEPLLVSIGSGSGLVAQEYLSARCRHQMEKISTLLALCAGNSPVTGAFPSQRPVTRSFDVFFYVRMNKRLSKQTGDLRLHRTHYDVTVMIPMRGTVSNFEYHFTRVCLVDINDE